MCLCRLVQHISIGSRRELFNYSFDETTARAVNSQKIELLMYRWLTDSIRNGGEVNDKSLCQMNMHTEAMCSRKWETNEIVTIFDKWEIQKFNDPKESN